MKRKKKGFLIVFLLLLLAAAVGFIIWFIRNQNENTDAGSDTVFTDSVATLTGVSSTGVIQRFAGVVEPQKTWNVENGSDKKVKEWYVKEGDEVKVGDKLFSYDTTDAEESLIEGQIEVDRYNGDIENYNNQIKTLQADKAKASADDQLDYNTQIQTVQNSLKKAQYDLQKQQVENQNLQKSIDNATVTSELAGVVKTINDSDNSSSAMSSDENNYLVTIVAVGQYRIKGTLNEQNRSSIMVGASVIVHSRVNEDQIWKGTISEIDTDNPISNSNSNNSYYGGSSDSSTQSSNYPFYVELDSIDGLIMGQHVYLEMDYGQADQKSGMWLSSYYIVQDDGDPYVWAANSKDKIEKRKVTLGEYDADQEKYEILDGLTADDYIAFPNEYIKEGADAEKNVDQMSGYNDVSGSDSDSFDDLDVSDWTEGTGDTWDTEDTEDFETETYGIVDDETDTEEGTDNSGDPLLDIEDYTENIGDGSAPVSADGEGA